MDKNKKYILIGISILIILILIVSITVAIKNNKKSKTKVEELKSYNLNEVIDIENIENTKYRTEKIKSSEKVSPNYIIGDKSYKLNGNVKLGEKEGEMYFIRGEHNEINLYKEKYRIDKYDSIATQVEGIINNFEENIKSYLGIEYNKKAKYENLEGKDESKYEIPLGEKIYNQERKYSKIYEVEEKEYEINFYRENEKLICELVYKLK